MSIEPGKYVVQTDTRFPLYHSNITLKAGTIINIRPDRVNDPGKGAAIGETEDGQYVIVDYGYNYSGLEPVTEGGRRKTRIRRRNRKQKANRKSRRARH